MKKLVLGALVIGLAACGGGSDKNKIIVIDSGGDSGTGMCNVLTQTGCTTGEKCTWIEDATTPTPLGHIGCAPAGTAATGAGCTYGAPGATGYDNCVTGDVCSPAGAKCEVICDQAGGAPMCGTGFACATYDGLFGPEGQAVAAGICDATCDPLADNDFDGSGSNSGKTGTACASTQGCYGEPDSAQVSHYTCTEEVNMALFHRAPCTTADNCANPGGQQYLNGCSEGYIPILYDNVGSMQVDCIAYCKPANCSSGACGAGSGTNLPGDPTPQVVGNANSVYQCNNNHESGMFNTGGNGDQCMFSWLFETDPTSGVFMRSPNSDTLGICVDHTRQQYDSTGGGSANAPWPICNSFTTLGFGTGSAVAGACTAANGCVGAADFGCVNTTVGGVMFTGKAERHVVVDLPRMLYHRKKM